MTHKAEEVLRITSRQDALNKLALSFTEWLIDNGYFTTCINCEHWKAKEEICGKFNQRPPAKIIVTGCEEHSDNIPF